MKKFLSLVLIFIFTLGPASTVRAAETETAVAQAVARQRREDLNFFWEKLNTTHPNLFSVTPESEFLSKIETLSENLSASAGSMDALTFAMNLQSIAALAGDSHTMVNMNSSSAHFYGFGIKYYSGTPVLAAVPKEYEPLLGKEVTAVNGLPLTEVYERFSKFLSHDNGVKLRRQFEQLSYAAEILTYLGIAEPGTDITVTVMDGEPQTITLSPVTNDALSAGGSFVSLNDYRKETPATEFNRERYYFSMPLNGSVYYIQYNQCVEDPELTMEAFCAQVREDLRAGGYSAAAVDLRYNGGGSDGLLAPMLDLLAEFQRKGGMKIFCLTGDITFSSATTNAMMMKDMGAVLVGTPTGGSVDHFGSTSRFKLPNSGIRVVSSTKFISVKDYFESGHGYGIEALTPDYVVPETLEDFLRGADTAVEFLLANWETLTVPDDAEKDLTRGRFMTLVHAKAKEYGKGTETGPVYFGDTVPFMESYPAIQWGVNIPPVFETSGKAFSPSRQVTVNEALAVLELFSKYLGRPGRLTPLPEYFTPRGTITVKQGRWLIDMMFTAAPAE